MQHLLTFLELKQPGPLFRGFVLLTQGIFFNLYFLYVSALPSPAYTHNSCCADVGMLHKFGTCVMLLRWALSIHRILQSIEFRLRQVQTHTA